MIKTKNRPHQEMLQAKNSFVSMFLFILILIPSCLLTATVCNSNEALTPSFPDPDTFPFQNGDLIWPKKPGKLVLKLSNEENDEIYEKNKEQWEQEKNDFISKIEAQDKETANRLAKMSFENFLSLYFGGEDWRQYAFNYSDDKENLNAQGYDSPLPIYIGHVGIIFLEDGVPWVVEAYPPVVRKIKYKDWLKQYRGASVWLRRLKESPEKISEIVNIACEQERKKKPYSLCPTLNDDTKFYCSKLIWFSFKTALGRSIEDNPSSYRLFPWYTPKMLIQSQHLKPGEGFSPPSEAY